MQQRPLLPRAPPQPPQPPVIKTEKEEQDAAPTTTAAAAEPPAAAAAAGAGGGSPNLSQSDILKFLHSHGLKDTAHLFQNELSKLKKEESSSSSSAGVSGAVVPGSGANKIKTEPAATASANDVHQATNVLSSYSSEGDPHMYSQV